MYAQVPETITIDSKEVAVKDLSAKTQSLAFVYTKWQNELIDARLEVDKMTIALKEAEKQLADSVKEDLTPKDDAANDSAAA
jgi:hypothetical protein